MKTCEDCGTKINFENIEAHEDKDGFISLEVDCEKCGLQYSYGVFAECFEA